MAFIIKSSNKGRAAGAGPNGQAVVSQYIHVVRAGAVLPATGSYNIFQVVGGKVQVQALIGTVTTICSATATNLKVSGTTKSNAGVTIGTAVDVAINAAVTSREVGGFYFVEGDGTAGVLSNAGASFMGANSGSWVMPQGFISLTTDATNTGAFQWDLFYQPLDEGAYAVAV